jgi:Na+/H+ antiporter NhaD/arsenite permease-like protein
MDFKIEFIFFALILLGVALFHKKAIYFSAGGFIVILAYKLIFDPAFPIADHFFGDVNFIQQLAEHEKRVGEWGIILNLFGLLLGFAILSKLFEESGIPAIIPRFLPGNWTGPLILLVFVYILSTFLDNIAAALLGGTIALIVFRHKVHIGYIAGIVAASNAGGAGSVLGDTTTTMMWIEGVSAFAVIRAFLASFVALLVFSFFAARQQFKFQPIQPEPESVNIKIDWKMLTVVIFILAGAIFSNVYYDMPALGVWVVIIISSLFIRVPWSEVSKMMRSTIFLICLVLSASLMPVEELPSATWESAFFLGILSSVFDNIPLTKLCLEQGFYDWGLLAYAVGFGGSMVWFGSSAGVAITSKFAEARYMLSWLKNGWHVALAYVAGFYMFLLIIGWHPSDTRIHKVKPSTESIEGIQGSNY